MKRLIASAKWLAIVVAAVLSAGSLAAQQAPPAPSTSDVDAASLGVKFVDGSSSLVVIERDGQQYEVNLAAKTVRKIEAAPQQSSSRAAVPLEGAPAPTRPGEQEQQTAAQYYRPADDLVFDLPTGRPLARHSWTVNFTHRFPYAPAFVGSSRGHYLLGLDDFAIPSFGLQYGVTDRLSVSVYRSPSIVGRPIELGARFDLLQERRHAPFNAAFRFSVDGQNDFSRNFTTNFELITSRSFGEKAQIYLVPFGSIHNRPTLGATSQLVLGLPEQPCGQAFANDVPASLRVRPCADTFSVGAGVAVDIRPTVTLIAEAIPTLVNGPDLGIHRVPFSFGIQKKIWHHGFTFGVSTGPGTVVSQRIATRSIFLRDPHADTPDKLFLGFNIMRQF